MKGFRALLGIGFVALFGLGLVGVSYGYLPIKYPGFSEPDVNQVKNYFLNLHNNYNEPKYQGAGCWESYRTMLGLENWCDVLT